MEKGASGSFAEDRPPIPCFCKGAGGTLLHIPAGQGGGACSLSSGDMQALPKEPELALGGVAAVGGVVEMNRVNRSLVMHHKRLVVDENRPDLLMIEQEL